ncbi:phosphatase PAP2 family protein [Streptomyces sp. NPDC088725]|uniref:phosphatase PAP2 family protein n=1 Tax=Streptomyces sp. NPDC088725 TaxID=3365873 RepID=UPI003830E439
MRPPPIPSPASFPSPSAPPAPPARPPLITPLRAAVAFALCSALLTALVVAQWDPLLSFDRAAAVGLHRRAVADPALTRAVRVLSDWMWDPLTMRAVTAVAVILLFLRGERLFALWVTVTSACGTACLQILKAAVDRDRPRWHDPVGSAHFSSFPSGHALTAAVTCGLLLWLLRRRTTARWVWCTAVAAAALSVVGVGLTRLWLGVHWSSDVLAGWSLGGCVVALSLTAYDRRVHTPGLVQDTVAR